MQFEFLFFPPSFSSVCTFFNLVTLLASFQLLENGLHTLLEVSLNLQETSNTREESPVSARYVSSNLCPRWLSNRPLDLRSASVFLFTFLRLGQPIVDASGGGPRGEMRINLFTGRISRVHILHSSFLRTPSTNLVPTARGQIFGRAN